MAHEFESGFFTIEAPWHGLGTVIPDVANWEDIPALAPLVASLVNKEPMYHDNKRVDGWYLTVREADKKVLSPVQSKYTVIQNMDAFEIGKILIDEGVCDIENMFTLRNGKWAIGVFKWKNNVDSTDPVIKYLLIVNTFDGSAPLRVFFSGVRAVCMNTVRMALNEAENMMIIRHTESSEEKRIQAIKTMESAKDYFANMEKIFAEMKTKTFTVEQLTSVIKKVYGMKEETEENKVSAKSKTQNANIINKIIDLSKNGKGTDLPGVRGTAWGAWNAISEYTDHYSTIKIHGTGGDESVRKSKEQESRVFSNLFGTSDKVKQDAMNEILEMVGIAA